MRALILACLLLLTTSPLFAGDPNAVVFPPANCSSGEQRVITWQNGTTTTYCATGQQVMTLAIPACIDGQTVVKEAGQFICKTVPNPPACGANEFLTFDGADYACGATNVPTCGSNQVLTFNGSAFVCVNRTDQIPTCSSNQFLTYNGSTFQCASTQQVAIPNCGANQVVMANGSSLYCGAPNAGQCSNGQQMNVTVVDRGGCRLAWEHMECHYTDLSFTCVNGIWSLSAAPWGSYQ